MNTLNIGIALAHIIAINLFVYIGIKIRQIIKDRDDKLRKEFKGENDERYYF